MARQHHKLSEEVGHDNGTVFQEDLLNLVISGHALVWIQRAARKVDQFIDAGVAIVRFVPGTLGVISQVEVELRDRARAPAGCAQVDLIPEFRPVGVLVLQLDFDADAGFFPL